MSYHSGSLKTNRFAALQKESQLHSGVGPLTVNAWKRNENTLCVSQGNTFLQRKFLLKKKKPSRVTTTHEAKATALCSTGLRRFSTY